MNTPTILAALAPIRHRRKPQHSGALSDERSTPVIRRRRGQVAGSMTRAAVARARTSSRATNRQDAVLSSPGSQWGEPGRSSRAVVVLTLFPLVAAATWGWAFQQRGWPWGDLRFLIWGLLVLALGIASGATFEFGLRRRRSIDQVQPVPWRTVESQVVRASVVLGAATLLNLVVEPSWGTVRGIILTGMAITGATPALIAMIGVRQAVVITGGHESTGSASRVNAYLELRSVTLRLLPALGSLVALTTFALGASRLAHVASAQNTANIEWVIATGALGTALVALAFAVPNRALRGEARALVRTLAPLNDDDTPALLKQLDQREKLERQLGLNVTFFGDLQAGVALLGPLLAASVSVFLPTS